MTREYPLTDRQRDMLRALLPSLERAELKTSWGLSVNINERMTAHGVPAEAREQWMAATLSDFRAFIKSGLMDVVRYNERGTESVVELNSHLILDAIRNNFRVNAWFDLPSSGQNITLSGDFRGSNVNVASVLQNASQTIGASTSLPDDVKVQLEYLVKQLNEALQEVPNELAEDAEAAAEHAKAVVEQVTKDKPNHRLLKVNAEVITDIVQERGRIDVLVNNAAISIPGTIFDDTLENWRRQNSINLEAVYMGSKLVAPHMVAREYGRIISIASIQGFASSGEIGAYNAAKGGVIAYTKSMAVELGKYNILVNVVAPGFIRTSMSIKDGLDETTAPDYIEWYIERGKVPLRRTGLPEDVSGTVVFLASDYCRYMTGQVLVVDGGLTTTF